MAAMIVINGTIERSWKSRIEKARSPNGVLRRPADCSSGSTCAVDDKASGPSASATAAVEAGGGDDQPETSRRKARPG